MTTRHVPVVGLTGPVSSGKSTVARFLGEAGARVVDVDALGHEALEEITVRDAVVREFGPGVLRADGTLDRAALAGVAFRTASARERLEALVHPPVRERIRAAIDAARADGSRAVALDCALLFESGLDRTCDVTVCVDAPEPVRLERARARHGWDAGEVRRRDAAQLSPAEKRARADRVLENDGAPERLRAAALALLDEVAPARRAAGDERREKRRRAAGPGSPAARGTQMPASAPPPAAARPTRKAARRRKP